MSPAKPNGAETRGYIVPIGGAEEKISDRHILSRFVEICGGNKSDIAVVPTASKLDDTGDRYRELLLDIGARKVHVLPFQERADCEREDYLETIQKVDGLFMTGGNQLRLSTMIGGTPVAQLIRRRNASGMHIAGTSAGAAFVPEHMIAGGEEGPTPKAEMTTLAPGLGLTNRFIIDQHFRERDRLGRLLAALAYNPFAVGMGLDEDTAAFIAPDETLKVVGSGGITIVDPSKLTYSSMSSAHKGDPVSLIGIRMHILVNGGTYDIETREAYPK
ncbi:MAG: cyanophycinase [Gammaproteobacteria bacterium]|nr:cyanophycinase [Gammaproteobacteria bacterium]